MILAPFRLATANAGKPRPQTREWRFNATTNYRLAAISDNKNLKAMSVGGALRWEDKAVVGYFGGEPSSDGAVREYDPNRPIFDKARTCVDLMATYETRLFDDRVHARFQLNVRNAFEGGRLQAIVTIQPFPCMPPGLGSSNPQVNDLKRAELGVLPVA